MRLVGTVVAVAREKDRPHLLVTSEVYACVYDPCQLRRAVPVHYREVRPNSLVLDENEFVSCE